MSQRAWNSLTLRWLGTLEYEEGLKVQNDRAEAIRSGAPGVVLACEHPLVITMGKRGQPLSDVLVAIETLRSQNVKIVATDRGGQATLHNPGQLVIYPILPLQRWGLGVRRYVECLERATASLLSEYGMDVISGYEPGLFVNDKKIASFGIRIDRGVSLHGAAINIYNDTAPFEWIRQCGLSIKATQLQREIESFSAQVPHLSLPGLANQWLDLFIEELDAASPKTSEVVVGTSI